MTWKSFGDAQRLSMPEHDPEPLFLGGSQSEARARHEVTQRVTVNQSHDHISQRNCENVA